MVADGAEDRRTDPRRISAELIERAATARESHAVELHRFRVRKVEHRVAVRRARFDAETVRLGRLLDDALSRDLAAERRDRLAEVRDRFAARGEGAGVGGVDVIAARAQTDRAAALVDRVWAGQDRDAAAGQRYALLAHAERLAAVYEREAAEDEEEIANLMRAIDTRASIGTAIGLLMRSNQTDGDRAYQLLVSASQRTNQKLRDIAAQLVEHAESEATPE